MAERDKEINNITNPPFFLKERSSWYVESSKMSGTTATSIVTGEILSGNVLRSTQPGELIFMHPSIQQEDTLIDFPEEVTDPQLYYQTKAILEEVKILSRKQDVHDLKTSEEHKHLLQKMEKIEAENTYFRRQLAEINTPQKLERYSISLGIFSIISIGISKISGVDIVNPILAYMMFGICAVFYVMAIIMDIQDKNNKKDKK